MGKLSDKIDSRLKELGIAGSKMCDDLGMSRSTLTELRKGRAVTLKAEKAVAVASYLGLSVEELLGTEKAPSPEGERSMGFDDFTYAMSEETKDLPQEKKDMLLQMARFMNQEQKREKGNQ